MTEFNEVKDSGERRDFGTGSVRDVRTGKGRFDLIPPIFLRRLARHVENGAVKYGDKNWELGQPLSSYLDSGMRHTVNLLALDVDEDHAAAVAWNAMAFMCTAEWIKSGMLPRELDDIGYVDALEEAEEDAELEGGRPYVPRNDAEAVWQNVNGDSLVADHGPGERSDHRTYVGDDPFYTPPEVCGDCKEPRSSLGVPGICAAWHGGNDVETARGDVLMVVSQDPIVMTYEVSGLSQATLDLLVGSPYPEPETTTDLEVENMQAATRRAVQEADARRVQAISRCEDPGCSLCNPQPRPRVRSFPVTANESDDAAQAVEGQGLSGHLNGMMHADCPVCYPVTARTSPGRGRWADGDSD
jgi:hypothetical protein